MGAISKYGTTFVVLINTLFGLIGLFFLVAGGLVKFAPQYIDKYAGKLIDAVKGQMPEELADHLGDIKISEFVGEAATGFLIIGGILVAIVMWAYCGTCCKSRWMLIVYAGLLTAIILGEVAVAVLFTTNRNLDNIIDNIKEIWAHFVIDEKLKKPLQESLNNYYEGSTSNSAISLGWNALMGLLKCCGVDGPGDFKDAKIWKPTNEISVTPIPSVTLDTPVICLKDKENGIQALINAGSSTDDMFIQTGCYDAIWNVVEENQSIGIGVIAAAGALQIMLWIMTVCIIREMGGGKNKVSPS